MSDGRFVTEEDWKKIIEDAAAEALSYHYDDVYVGEVPELHGLLHVPTTTNPFTYVLSELCVTEITARKYSPRTQ